MTGNTGRLLFDPIGVMSIDPCDSVKIMSHRRNVPINWVATGCGQPQFSAEGGGLCMDMQSVNCEKTGSVQRISLCYTPREQCDIELFSLTFDFMAERADLWEAAEKSFHWLPNLKADPRHVAGQHVFRAPAAILTVGEYCAALIPDLCDIEKHPQWSRFLDLRFHHEEGVNVGAPIAPPTLTFGIQSTEPAGHFYYQPDGKSYHIDPSGISLSFYLVEFLHCSDTDLLGFIIDFQWRLFAPQCTKSLLPQTAPFAKYALYGNGMALQYLWEQGPRSDTGGICLVTHRRTDGVMRGREYSDDLWFHAWFNNMRTAMELAEFGRTLGRSDWTDKAAQIAACLSASPQKEGIFPTIYAPRDGGWVGSSEHGGGKGLYSLPDCAWSALWLRKYTGEYGAVEGAEAFLGRFRQFLCDHQNPSGGFPCWVTADTLRNDGRLDDSASGALAVWFLGEELLCGAVPAEERGRALDAVLSGAGHIIGEVIPQQRFEDFELYYSCSQKPLDFYDPISCLYGQNTLAIQWCAEALRVTFLLSNDPKHLDQGLFCLRLLSLYQQVWNTPFLDFYTFGGFGVMNTDGEWNDARQAQFAETYMNYYDLTGDFALFQRGVAAARAAFALMVMDENEAVSPRNYKGTTFNFEVHGASAENYGHAGGDFRSGQSGFHWGTGSALVTACRLKKRYGDLLIDWNSKMAAGIDGVAVARATFTDHSVFLELDTLPEIDRIEIRMAAAKGADHSQGWKVCVKGFDVSTEDGAERIWAARARG